MFGIFKSAIKAAAGVVIDVPLAIVCDTVTLGGELTDRKRSYTSAAAKRLVENVKDIADPDL